MRHTISLTISHYCDSYLFPTPEDPFTRTTVDRSHRPLPHSLTPSLTLTLTHTLTSNPLTDAANEMLFQLTNLCGDFTLLMSRPAVCELLIGAPDCKTALLTLT